VLLTYHQVIHREFWCICLTYYCH